MCFWFVSVLIETVLRRCVWNKQCSGAALPERKLIIVLKLCELFWAAIGSRNRGGECRGCVLGSWTDARVGR